MILGKYFDLIKRLDFIILSVVIILVIFSLVAIYSIAVTRETSDYSLLVKQGVAFLVGLILLFLISLIDYRILRSYANILYLIGIALLIAVLILGVTIRGTKGWFSFGFFAFQPVELVKILVVILVAKYLAQKSSEITTVRHLLTSGLFVLLPVLLVLFQPDMGSSLIFLALWLGMIALSKITRAQVLLIITVLILIFLVGWFSILKDYQKERIFTFLQPGKDPLCQGYNISQSIVAIGSGQFWGRGLSLGPQSRLNFLPAKETDFIFAVIAESLGFVGSFLVLVLFGILFWRIIKITREAQDDFGIFLAWGILLLIAIQVFINIGMNLGLAPVAGLSLPFISAGGSSLVVNLLTIGILESIYLRSRRTVV